MSFLCAGCPMYRFLSAGPCMGEAIKDSQICTVTMPIFNTQRSNHKTANDNVLSIDRSVQFYFIPQQSRDGSDRLRAKCEVEELY